MTGYTLYYVCKMCDCYRRVFLVQFILYFPAVKCLGSTLDFGTDKEKKIAPELDELLSHIAKTGRTEYVINDIFRVL